VKAFLFLAALCFAAPALAQTLDADHNGAVTRAELEAATIAGFAEADANHDGLLNAAELAASFSDPTQLLYIVDADQDGALNAEEWHSYAAGAAAIAFMLCDANHDDVLTGAEIECSQG
jgi:EF hand